MIQPSALARQAAALHKISLRFTGLPFRASITPAQSGWGNLTGMCNLLLHAGLTAGVLECRLAEDRGRTSTVRWPCMCVMQAAAVLRMVRLASFPDALQHHERRPSDPPLQPLRSHAEMVLLCTVSGHCPCADCMMRS